MIRVATGMVLCRSGEYEYRIDLDEDGFYEVSGIISVGDETEVFEPINIIPDMYDVSISLQAPVADNGSALVEVGNQNFTLTLNWVDRNLRVR